MGKNRTAAAVRYCILFVLINIRCRCVYIAHKAFVSVMYLHYTKGNTAGRTPYGLAPHMLRPKEVPLGYSFSVILHKTRLITVRLTTLVLHNLTKKLAAHLRHYLCAVLPKLRIR